MDTPATSSMAAGHRKGARTHLGAVLLGLACLTVAPHVLHAQGVPEPETVLYGRVVNRTSGQEFQLTDGTLSWTILGDAGKSVTLTTPLKAVAGGSFSYILKVPHQAQSLDLSIGTGVLPLRTDTQVFSSGTITINGQPAKVRTTDGSSFTASQPERAKALRLDLEVFDALVDTDLDGMPDWWEDIHGLNKQWGGDAALHHGSNHYTYLQDFLLGLDPDRDETATQLITHEVTVMEGGATGLLLKAVNTQTLPSQLTYQLGTLPRGGTIVLRNVRTDPKMPSRTLKAGDTFTQEAVDAGQVEFVQSDPSVKTTTFSVSVSDGNGASVTGDVAVTVYRPAALVGGSAEPWLLPAAGALPPTKDSVPVLWKKRTSAAFATDWVGGASQRNRITAYLLSKWFDYSIWDAAEEPSPRTLAVPSARMTAAQYASTYVPRYGPARNHVLFGSSGNSRMEGGMGSDILVAGSGQNTLVGNGGADVFVFATNAGTATVEDFKSAEGDVIDISGLLTGSATDLAAYVKATISGKDTNLAIDAAGTGADYTTATIVLRNTALTQAAVQKLWLAGSIFTGRAPSTIPPANHPPAAVADAAFVVKGQSVAIPVLANDSDADGDSLILTGVSACTAGFAQVTGNAVLYTPGLAFAGNDSFTYLISDGHGGTATGTVKVSYPFPAAAGVYAPLVLDAAGRLVGQINLTLTSTGAFTITITTAAGKLTGKGVFDGNGLADVDLGKEKTALSLHLAIDLMDPAHHLTGAVYGSGEDLTIATDTVLADAKRVPGKARNFTLALDAPTDVPAIQGRGFATIAVSAAYAVTFAGRTGDGTSFTMAATQRANGSVLCSSILPKNLGWLVANLSLVDSPTIPAGGTVRWLKRDAALAASAAPVLDQLLQAVVSPYVVPSVAASHAMDFTDASVALADVHLRAGGLAVAGQDKVIQFGSSDVIKVTSPAGDALKLALTRSTGLLSGTTVIGGSARVVSGVVLQNVNLGYGLFLNGVNAGSLEVDPR